eukprot:COSAG01_NODE_1552_length_9933_cov_13.631483_10_plen_110_part_00
MCRLFLSRNIEPLPADQMGRDARVLVWSSASLALLMRLPVFHSARISALAFSWGEGNILASTGAEGAAGGVRPRSTPVAPALRRPVIIMIRTKTVTEIPMRSCSFRLRF